MMELSKSKRVEIIKNISNHLGTENWSTIDLTLKQFGFHTSDQWSGDKESYIIGMIDEADNADLIELSQHFGMQFETANETTVPNNETTYWNDGQLKVFISHLTNEKEQASHIKSSLKKFGMSGFVAHADITPTQEWQIAIETALATCDLLIAIIHPKFVESKWCDQEIGYALGKGIPVFTVRCGNDPHGFVSRFQAFNGNNKSPHDIAKDVFEASIIHKKLQERMADIVINLFIDSQSFELAKTRLGYVEKLQIWEKSYSTRIEKALNNNSQIKGSWGVPEQIEQLLQKWKET